MKSRMPPPYGVGVGGPPPDNFGDSFHFDQGNNDNRFAADQDRLMANMARNMSSYGLYHHPQVSEKPNLGSCLNFHFNAGA